MFDTKTRTLVVVGAQWGDEGKGKLVDVLAERADWVVRYQGGANAGHTVHIGDAKFVLIAGAEAMYSARRARAKDIDLGWSPRGTPAADAAT